MEDEMGYDMYWDSYSRGGSPEPPGAYFQLNIGGMHRTVAAMTALDMAFESASEPTRDEWNSLPAYDETEGEDGGTEYRKAVEALVGRHAGEERPGIPVHKIYSTNDGWHVKPIECLGALHQWEQAKAADAERVVALIAGISWWDEWLTFIERAAREGNGFRVH